MDTAYTQDRTSGFASVHTFPTQFLSMEKMESPTRTDGDGMEQADEDCTSENNKTQGKPHSQKVESLRDKFIYNPEDFKNSILKPPNISGKIVQLRPAQIIVKNPKHDSQARTLQAKEPKFVPYEPYKGAVNPMIPLEKNTKKKKSKKISSSSLPEPNKLKEETPYQASLPDISLNKNNQLINPNDDRIQHELERLRKENQQLENQLKFQIQVNGDLKNLLVASVGEDMETRVHILTEDKLHLARALLNSAQKLDTHQEQTEWLAGQCEVWRSKFLASSIMVEELAKWKALLTRRVQDLQNSTKHLLAERSKVREYLISTYKDLCILCDNFDVTSLRSGIHKLSSSNILDLSEVDMQLSAVVRLQLLGNGLVPSTSKDVSLLNPHTTEAEALAMELLKHSVPELESADAAYSAVMGAAITLNSTSHLISPACCGQCTGEIKTV